MSTYKSTVWLYHFGKVSFTISCDGGDLFRSCGFCDGCPKIQRPKRWKNLTLTELYHSCRLFRLLRQEFSGKKCSSYSCIGPEEYLLKTAGLKNLSASQIKNIHIKEIRDNPNRYHLASHKDRLYISIADLCPTCYKKDADPSNICPQHLAFFRFLSKVPTL